MNKRISNKKRMKDQYFEWVEKYKPVGNHFESKNGAYDGTAFETYGEELSHIFEIHKTNPKKVWTEVDADGKSYIVAGFHIVNRLNYFITENEWEIGTEEFFND